MTAPTTTPSSAANRTTPGKAPGKSRSLWQEAMQRLVRNRAALTGGIIIILLVLTALFADLIAPYSFEKQSLLNANAVPDWVTRIFPSLKADAVINNEYPIGAAKAWAVRLSQPGSLPGICPGADDVCLQFSGRWLADAPEPRLRGTQEE